MKRRHWAVALFLVSPMVVIGCGEALSGSGWSFKPSLTVDKPHARQIVSAPDHPVRYGKHSERFEVRPGDCARDGRKWSDCEKDRERSELMQIAPHQYEGDEYWYRWSIFVPADHTNIYPVKLAYGQFHQIKCKVAVQFREDAGGYYFNLQRVLTGFDDLYPLLTKEQFVGKWNDIVVNAGWRRGDDGWFKVWANGKQKVDYKGRTMTCDRPYFRYGIYRSFISRNADLAGKVPTIVYYDGVVRSRSREGMFDPLPE